MSRTIYGVVLVDPIATIFEVVNEGARTIGDSLLQYWPTSGDNDPAEANVVIHIAEKFLTRGFACFAEAQFPEHTTKKRLDFLAIDSESNWFIACEFKRLFDAGNLKSMHSDIASLAEFWLIPHASDAANKPALCSKGYALAGGLHWLDRNQTDSDFLKLWRGTVPKSQKFQNARLEIDKFQPTWIPPIDVCQFDRGSRYVLLLVCFEIPKHSERLN